METRKRSDGWRDFPGDIIRLHESIGWHYHAKFIIWKEPLRVAIKTRALGLMHKQLMKDSTHCYAAVPDYVIAFRKPGQNKTPVAHGSGITRYAGANQPPGDLVEKYRYWKNPKTNKLSHYIWQRYASSVWMDIRAGRLMKYKEARESEEEKHCCPLQLDVIERALTLYSNPGDVMLTPFMGVGSEVCGALAHGRKGIGVELKATYYRQALSNIKGVLQNGLAGNEYEGDIFSEPEEME
jgi:DNA modification methylase